MSAILELDQVSKRYSKNGTVLAALDAVNLTLQPGEFVAARGPSGSGKTTLLLIAGGLLRPDGGVARIAGEDLYALPAEARASRRAERVGFVFQQFHLAPYLNVLDNVTVPALALADGRAAARDRARQLLERFGLAERLTHFPSELSTGERQRTALARALLNQPPLLLADEPTGNLDPGNADIVLQHLAEFAAAGGAVLMVTHEQAALERVSRVIRLAAGRIVE